jgi:hypothetical protein
MDRFYELSDDTIDDFYKIFNKKSFPVSIKFQFIGDSKQKGLVKISKIADDFAFVLQKELKVQQMKTKFYKAGSILGIGVAIITTTLYIIK